MQRNSKWPTFLLIGAAVYFLTPLWWLFVSSTKGISGLFNGSNGAFWFDENFRFWDNLADLTTQSGGVYFNWLGNSAIYAFGGALGATILSLLAGYAFAKYDFPFKRSMFSALLAAVMVPVTALVLPIFVMFSALDLTNTRWAVLLPAFLNPFAVYIIRIFAIEAIPDELMQAARVDGASETRIFFKISFPLLSSAIATVYLLSVVSIWNNFFLPLTVLNDPKLFPVTVGLGNWLQLSGASGGGQQLWHLIITGAFVSVLPLILAFFFLQRYWQAGLTAGAEK